MPVRLKSATTLFAATLFAAAAAQQPAQIAPSPSGLALPAVQPPGRAAVGVALEGGGALGLAHIGLFTFGVSAGDAGHRKVFLTLGRLF
jgi:predicted acylesterase/phospholipase RssA